MKYVVDTARGTTTPVSSWAENLVWFFLVFGAVVYLVGIALKIALGVLALWLAIKLLARLFFD